MQLEESSSEEFEEIPLLTKELEAESAAALNSHQAKHSLSDEEEGTEETTCSICFESWSSNGTHRIVSLKCGHLFGKSCIERWIRSKERSNSSKAAFCPQCNVPTKTADIRPIYCAKRLSADVQCEECTKLQAALAQKSLELQQAKETEAKIQLSYQASLAEVSRLQRAYELQVKKAEFSSSLASSNFQFALHSNYTLCGSQEQATCLDYDHGKGILLVGMQQRAHESFGVLKVNLAGPPFDFYPLHRATVKQLRCSPSGNDRVLTASMDKSLVLSTFVGKALIWQKQFSSAVWSCAFHNLDENLLYAGLGDGSAVEMDLRQPSEPVRTFLPLENLPGNGRTPLHSISVVGSEGKHLIGANYGGMFRLSLEADAEGSGECIQLPEGGVMHHLSVSDGFLLASRRNKTSLCTEYSLWSEKDLKLLSQSKVPHFGRATLYSTRSSAEEQVFCIFNEKDYFQVGPLCSTTSIDDGKRLQVGGVREPVLEYKHLMRETREGNEWIVGLSSRALSLYSNGIE